MRKNLSRCPTFAPLAVGVWSSPPDEAPGSQVEIKDPNCSRHPAWGSDRTLEKMDQLVPAQGALEALAQWAQAPVGALDEGAVLAALSAALEQLDAPRARACMLRCGLDWARRAACLCGGSSLSRSQQQQGQQQPLRAAPGELKLCITCACRALMAAAEGEAGPAGRSCGGAVPRGGRGKQQAATGNGDARAAATTATALEALLAVYEHLCAAPAFPGVAACEQVRLL